MLALLHLQYGNRDATVKIVSMRDISTLDLNLLKALNALLDERNVTRAAARLGLTQPAMSGMLVRLRNSFGDQLFVRAQRGIAPTERALALAQPVRQVLADIDALLQAPQFDPATATMTFTIAATDYAQRAIAVRFFSELARRASAWRSSQSMTQACRCNSNGARSTWH